MIPRSAALALAALALVGVGFAHLAHRARRFRDEPGGELFVGMCLALALTSWFGAAAFALELRRGWFAARPVSLATLVLFPVVWAAFAARRGGVNWLTRRRAATLTVVLAAVTVETEVAVRALGPVEGSPVSVILFQFVPQFAAYAVTFTLLVVGVGILARQALRYDHLSVQRAIALSVGGVVPWLGTFMGFGIARTDATIGAAAIAVSYALGLVGFALGIVRYDLFDASGAAGSIGSEQVVATMDEAVVVTDGDGRVLDLNPAAEASFDADADVAAGRPLEAVVGASHRELLTADSMELDTVRGRRTFEPTASTITTADGDVTGYSFLLQDVTSHRTREQRLAVLNRVLRHNLRNQVGVINGYAQTLADRREDGDDAVDRITDTAEELVDLGEKALTVEELLEEPPVIPEGNPPAAVVEPVVDRVRTAHPDCSFDVAVRADVTVDANPRVLQPVVENLVENAAEHNDAVDPRVEVEVTTESDQFVVTVVDNGPGVPDIEQEVLQRGELTPLEHGSGLGLWVAKWGVTRLGGSLSLETVEPRGTVASVTVPRSTDAETSVSAPA